MAKPNENPAAIVAQAADVRLHKNQFLAAAKAGKEANIKRLENYRTAGIHLIEIKAIVGRSFGAWLKENCPYSERMAQRWMALAKSDTVSDLEAAWKVVTGRTDEPEPSSEQEDTATETNEEQASEEAETTETTAESEASTTAEASESADETEREPGDEEPEDEPEVVDAEGVPVPPRAVPAFETAKTLTGLCREMDSILKKVEEAVKAPGGRLIRFDSFKQQLKDAKGNIWANRASHVCPYCKGKAGAKVCECCKDEGWTSKTIWIAAPGNNKGAK